MPPGTFESVVDQGKVCRDGGTGKTGCASDPIEEVLYGGTDKPSLGFKRMSEELDSAVAEAIENREILGRPEK